MYFPYLHGKRFELLALRDFANAYLFDNTVNPIIEPVNSDNGDLLRALNVLGEKGFSPVVILNPYKSDFDSLGYNGWSKELIEILKDNLSWVPAIIADGRESFSSISSFIDFFGDRKVAVVYNDPVVSDKELSFIDASENVVYEIVLPGGLTPIQRGLVSKRKAVDIGNNFVKQKKNSEYHGKEFFSSQYKSYHLDSVGYGDYNVLPDAPSSGGGAPGAIALHITFKHPDSGNIWIEHFVSTSIIQFEVSDAEKYLDAVNKFLTEHGKRPAEFGDNVAIDTFAIHHRDSHFPQLSGNKRLQMLHHLCLNRQLGLGQL